MKRNIISLEEVKNKISELRGENIFVAINRGRKRIERFNAIIENIYPSVFTIKVDVTNQQNIQTFSYFDVLCGDFEILKTTGA